MSLPPIPPDSPTPRQWAEQVHRLEPHGLDVLEAHVFAYATKADELSKTSAWSMASTIVTGYLSFFGSVGGFAALVGNPRAIRRGWADEPDISVVPWASLSYTVGIVGVLLMFGWWLRNSRRRLPGPRYLLFFTIVFGALGIPFASRLAAEAQVDLGLTMLPTYIMMGLAALLFLLIQFSPRPDPEPQKPTVPIEELDEKALRYLMRERNEAIDIYVRRRLGPELDAKVLKARPLGQLHLGGH